MKLGPSYKAEGFHWSCGRPVDSWGWDLVGSVLKLETSSGLTLVREAAGRSSHAHPALVPSARSFSLTLPFPVILAELSNSHTPECSFTLIVFKILGTLGMLRRASAGAVLSVGMLFLFIRGVQEQGQLQVCDPAGDT